MLEQRNLKADLAALGLLALTVFLAASLLSYDVADPPNELVYPQRAEPANLCGQWGAMAAWLLLSGLGVGAYYLLFSLGVLDSVLLGRRGVGEPVLRAFGWLLSLVGVCTLVAMAVPGLSPGPVIGSGGYLGAAGSGLLERHFASVGAYILTTSLILGGLLLCTDYVVLQVLAWGVGKPAKGLGRGVVRVGAAYAGKLAVKRDEGDEAWEEDEEEEEETTVAVRIGGRSGEDPLEVEDADEEEVEEEDAEEEEEEAEAEEEAAAPAKASPLRIKKPRKSKREEVIEQIEAAQNDQQASDYELPGIDLLLDNEPFCFEEHEKDVRRKAKIVEKTFADFGFNIRVVEIQTGPVIAQFEVELEAGLRLSKITGLADDLAIALRVPSVRIVAPIPGKNTVGIEVPNAERQLVRLREVMEETNGKALKMRIPIYLGKDVAGNPMVVDLASLPHLLIAGRTGTGKSVCLNSIITSMLMTRRPDEVRMLMIDPKMVELSPYKRLPHLMHPVVTDMRKAEAILAWAVEKMEERYHLLAQSGVRHISVYNQLGREELLERMEPATDEEAAQIPSQLPYIVIVADEMADLMMTSAKEVEGHIIRLAQKSRAVGIHLVLATQKPTVDVITGLIKSNLPARIAFQVASRTDSRVVLDEMGADKLLGNGDMLFLWPGTSTLLRGQGTYLSDDEINCVIGAVATSEPQFVKELVQLKTSDPGEAAPKVEARDELYEAAIDIVIREGRGSVSLLQRTLGIGYGRAARLIDFMAEDGIVGPYNGSQAREILVSLEEWESMSGQSAPPEATVPAKPAAPKPAKPAKRSNKIRLQPASEPDAAVHSRDGSLEDIEDEEAEDIEEDQPEDDEELVEGEYEETDDEEYEAEDEAEADDESEEDEYEYEYEEEYEEEEAGEDDVEEEYALEDDEEEAEDDEEYEEVEWEEEESDDEEEDYEGRDPWTAESA